tara:strand:+ start:247 stop:453 length:207 start_codon:yes stop_codon:yes gene_type:complete
MLSVIKPRDDSPEEQERYERDLAMRKNDPDSFGHTDVETRKRIMDAPLPSKPKAKPKAKPKVKKKGKG